MFSLIVVACLSIGGAPNCEAGRRVDVVDQVWPVPMGCLTAVPGVVAQWSEANPSWRVVEVRCVPTLRVPEVISDLEGEAV